MTHCSLFSGIGGFDLAAEWMGWNNVFQVEWDSYCQKVLAKNFPNTKRYGDIKEFDGTKYRGLIDIISGGFPCQPFSNAGKKQGRKDDRYLWPEMLRVIKEIKPSYIVGENVAGLISMDNGKILDSILSDLALEGYTTEQFIIPACAVGAWHRRDRIWIIAYLNTNGYTNGKLQGQESSKEGGESLDRTQRLDKTNSNNRSKRNEGVEPEKIQELEGFQRGENQRIYADWERRPDLFTPILCRSYDGLPYGVDRIKGLGNAIVPQVAYQIFKAIEHVKS
jgi:DNA (cytosine-5)-methyltransferase 1